MGTASLLTLDMRMEAMETTMDVAVSEYECEKQRVDKTIKSILDAKNAVIEKMSSGLTKKIESYKFNQQFLYRLLGRLVRKTCNYKVSKIIIKNNDKIVKETKTIISSMHTLEKSYAETLQSLERLRKYLINNCGTKGYVSLNDNMGFLPKCSSNMELVQNAVISGNECDNEKEKAALQRLIEYIKIDNDFWGEIKRIDLMIKKIEKLRERLKREIEYRNKDFVRIAQKVDENREKNDKLKAEIQDIRAKIDGILKENNGKNLEYYDNEIEKKSNYIAQERENLIKYHSQLAETEQNISEAINKREKLQDKARTFDRRTPSSDIDKHNKKYSDNENRIYSLAMKRQSILDQIAKSEANAENLSIKISGLYESRQLSDQAWKEFKNIFLKDYNNMNKDIDRYINEAIKKNGF